MLVMENSPLAHSEEAPLQTELERVLSPEEKLQLLYEEILDDAHLIPRLQHVLHEIPVAESLIRIVHLIKRIFGKDFFHAKEIYHNRSNSNALVQVSGEVMKLQVIYAFLHETFMISVKNKELNLMTSTEEDRDGFLLSHAEFHYHHALIGIMELVIGNTEWLSKKKLDQHWQ